MRIAVTGADGFVGTGLMSELAAAGHEPLDVGPATQLDVRNAEAVGTRVAELEPDCIVHLAAVSGPMLHANEPELVMAVNAVGTVNVLQVAHLTGAAVMLAGSVSGFTKGTPQQPRPASVYGVTKRTLELLAEVYREEHGVRCTTVRIGSVYGPGRRTEHVLDGMLASARVGEDVPYAASGREPLVHQSDAASLLAALAEVSHWRPTYDLVTTPISHADLAREVCELAGTGSQPRAEDRQVYTWPMEFDPAGLYEDTGRSARISVRAGVSELLRRS